MYEGDFSVTMQGGADRAALRRHRGQAGKQHKSWDRARGPEAEAGTWDRLWAEVNRAWKAEVEMGGSIYTPMTKGQYLLALETLGLSPHGNETAEQLQKSKRQLQRYAEGKPIPKDFAAFLRMLVIFKKRGMRPPI